MRTNDDSRLPTLSGKKRKTRKLNKFDNATLSSLNTSLTQQSNQPRVIGSNSNSPTSQELSDEKLQEIQEVIEQEREREQKSKINNDANDTFSFLFEGLFLDLLTINGKTKNDLIDYVRENAPNTALSFENIRQFIIHQLDRKDNTLAIDELEHLHNIILKIKLEIMQRGNKHPPFISLQLQNVDSVLDIEFQIEEEVSLKFETKDDTTTIFQKNLPPIRPMGSNELNNKINSQFTIKAWINAFKERYTFHSTHSLCASENETKVW